MSTIATGGNANNPFVLKSVFDQTVEKLETDVSRVEYIDIENIGDAEYSIKYEGISYGRANTYNANTLNNYGTFQKGPVFDLSPMSSTNWNGTIFCKLKVPNANTDYTLFLHSSEYRISELYFINADTTSSNFKIATNCVYSESIEGSKLEPLHFGNSKIGFLAIVIKNAGDDYTPTYNDFDTKPFTVKFGIPNSVAVSNIKQTADGIKSQVSDLQTTADGLGTTINTAVQNIVPGMINSTVASEVNGKLAGYSTIEQTKDFIASTVGAGSAVTNKFHDPLFKHDYSYWHKRYSNYPNYSNITNIVSPAANVYNKYYDNNNNYYQINSSNILEKDLKSFIIYDNNTLNINGLSAEDRRHIYGLYTNLKVISGNKYTASFYIKLPAVFSSGYTSLINVPNSNNKFRCSFQNLMLNVGFVNELAKLTPNFYITLLSTKNSLEDIENTKYTIVDGEEVENWSSETLYNTQHKKAYKFNNQGNLTGNGFNNGSVDLDQFGLWIKFG